jgi:hypothetical protein
VRARRASRGSERPLDAGVSPPLSRDTQGLILLFALFGAVAVILSVVVIGRKRPVVAVLTAR